jgi:hypothetical protein
MAEFAGFSVAHYDRGIFKALHGTPERTPTPESAHRFALDHWQMFPRHEGIDPQTSERRDGMFLFLDVWSRDRPDERWVYRIHRSVGWRLD